MSTTKRAIYVVKNVKLLQNITKKTELGEVEEIRNRCPANFNKLINYRYMKTIEHCCNWCV